MSKTTRTIFRELARPTRDQIIQRVRRIVRDIDKANDTDSEALYRALCEFSEGLDKMEAKWYAIVRKWRTQP